MGRYFLTFAEVGSVRHERNCAKRQPSLFVWLMLSCFALPLGGGATTSKKKTEMRMLVHCRIELAFSISMLDVCIKMIARFFFFVALPTLPADASWFLKKKHTREMQLLRRQWSNQMLFPCGALLAVHDGLNFAVRVSGRFLRSAVFLCIA